LGGIFAVARDRWHGLCCYGAFGWQGEAAARGSRMPECSQTSVVGFGPAGPSDWSELGGRIIEISRLALAVQARLEGQCTAENGAVLETPRETLGG
jgi:hypothetical protein